MNREITSKDIEELCKCTAELYPAFPERNVAVATFCSKEYLPMAAVGMQSVIAHADSRRNYDLIVVCSQATEEDHEKLQSMILGRENCSLRLVDGSVFMKLVNSELNQEDFFWSLCHLLCIFVPLVCQNYEKVVCIAADVITHTDISELYDMELRDRPLAATYTFYKHLLDKYSSRLNELIEKPWEYEDANSWRMPDDIYRKKLGTQGNGLGFNGDVLVLNVSLLNKEEFVRHGLNSMLKERWRTLGEAVYQKFYDAKKLPLSFEYNFISSPNPYNNIELDEEDLKVFASIARPKIIHYMGSRHKKPWVNPAAPLGWLWWKYARETPFYEQLLSMTFETMVKTRSQETEAYAKKMYNESHKLPSLKRKMRFLRVVRQFTFGKTRRRLKGKERALKARIREFRSLIR